MTPVPGGIQVWLTTKVRDMRQGMNTLVPQAQESHERDLHAGDTCMFRGRDSSLGRRSRGQAVVMLPWRQHF